MAEAQIDVCYRKRHLDPNRRFPLMDSLYDDGDLWGQTEKYFADLVSGRGEFMVELLIIGITLVGLWLVYWLRPWSIRPASVHPHGPKVSTLDTFIRFELAYWRFLTDLPFTTAEIRQKVIKKNNFLYRNKEERWFFEYRFFIVYHIKGLVMIFFPQFALFVFFFLKVWWW